MKQFTTRNQKIGEYGEKIAVRYLIESGFQIVERNFSTRLGEIDIIATFGDSLYFCEVKSTVGHGFYSPFENLNRRKLIRINRVIAQYVAISGVSHETELKIMGIAVTFSGVIGSTSLGDRATVSSIVIAG